MFIAYESVCYVTRGAQSNTSMKELDRGREERFYSPCPVPELCPTKASSKTWPMLSDISRGNGSDRCGTAVIDVSKTVPALAICHTWSWHTPRWKGQCSAGTE